MKNWKCLVCGFIHRETDPPDNCPVCGVDKDKFEAFEDATEKSEPQKQTESSPAEANAWRCTVCGYVHHGPEPPDICPVCGADKSKFEPLTEAESPAKETEITTVPKETTPVVKKPSEHWLITRLLVKNHAHPVSVHFPNGLLPVIVLFMLLYIFVQSLGLPVAPRAHYFAVAGLLNALIVLVAMPLVIVSGFADWKVRFKGAMTKIFKIKITCAIIVTIGTLALLLWAFYFPFYTFKDPIGKYLFWAAHLPVLGAAGLAGFLGGRLVFIDNDH
jgi:rubredoxin